MRNPLLASAILVFAAPASAQVLNETFDYSTTALFPPAGWSATTVTAPLEWLEASIATPIYSVLLSDAAAHDWSGTGTVCDSWLFAPTLDLSAHNAPELTFDSDVYYTQFMAHYPTPAGSGTSDVEVSSDGGVTWTNEWTETAVIDQFYPGIQVDLSAYAGMPSVDIAFVYGGDNGHDWGVDNVIVDNIGPTGPGLAVGGTCPGVMTLDASGMTPAGPVVFAYSLSSGSFTVPGGPCAGLTVPMASPVQLGTVIADGSGNASFSGSAPAAACGNVTTIAVDGVTCTASNPVGI
jgi:hypothetical protein